MIEHSSEEDETPDPLEDEEPKYQQPAPPPGVTLLEIVHELAMLTGTDPEYWKSRNQEATLRAYMTAIAVEKARRKEACPPMVDALSDAINNFRKAIVAIIKAHKEPQTDEEATQ